MASYKFQCSVCTYTEDVELDIQAPKNHYCTSCDEESTLVITTRDDVLIRRAATPGQHATRNMQDVNLLNHIRKQRIKHGYRSEQQQLQDEVDKLMFRKRGDTPANLPSHTRLIGKKTRPTKRKLDV